jgi:hypothetical protein
MIETRGLTKHADDEYMIMGLDRPTPERPPRAAGRYVPLRHGAAARHRRRGHLASPLTRPPPHADPCLSRLK